MWLLTDEAMGELVLPKRSLDHKRSVGTVLVIGGSKGMEGAAHLAAFAALRGGAGLVHAALPDGAGAQKPFAEVITVTVPGVDGRFGMAARSALFEQADQLGAVAVGPASAAPTRRGCWCASCSASTGRCCSTPTASTRSETSSSSSPDAAGPR